MLPGDTRRFQRDGFIVLKGAVPKRDLRRLRRSLDGIAREACGSLGAGADHDSVQPPSDAAAFQFEHDASGRVKEPLRVHKIQGVGLVSKDVTELLRSQILAGAALQLSGSEEIDAFGTKYFPAAAGSAGTVGWHDDNFYFGTTRSRTISCVCYLRDTRRESGCLRVVPASHLDPKVGPERAHLYKHDKERHGEYIPEETLLAGGASGGTKRAPTPTDVDVAEGSAVLFDANLLHAAWPNRCAASPRSERIAFHYIPTDVNSEFRGVSFARGAFADRHEATPSPTKRARR